MFWRTASFSETDMPKPRKQAWKAGDYFTIPLADGAFSLGQVIGIEPQALNSAICAFFAKKAEQFSTEMTREIGRNDTVSVLFVTRDLLDSGDWRVFSNGQEIDPTQYFPLIDMRRKGFVGTKVIGSGIVIKLMNAYYGLHPWNAFYKPDYLDELLVSPDRKPRTVVLNP